MTQGHDRPHGESEIGRLDQSRLSDSWIPRKLSQGVAPERFHGGLGDCRRGAADWCRLSDYRRATTLGRPLREHSAIGRLCDLRIPRQLVVGPDAATLTILAASLSQLS